MVTSTDRRPHRFFKIFRKALNQRIQRLAGIRPMGKNLTFLWSVLNANFTTNGLHSMTMGFVSNVGQKMTLTADKILPILRVERACSKRE